MNRLTRLTHTLLLLSCGLLLLTALLNLAMSRERTLTLERDVPQRYQAAPHLPVCQVVLKDFQVMTDRKGRTIPVSSLDMECSGQISGTALKINHPAKAGPYCFYQAGWDYALNDLVYRFLGRQYTLQDTSSPLATTAGQIFRFYPVSTGPDGKIRFQWHLTGPDGKPEAEGHFQGDYKAGKDPVLNGLGFEIIRSDIRALSIVSARYKPLNPLLAGAAGVFLAILSFYVALRLMADRGSK